MPHARLLARLILAVALAAVAVTPAHAQITWTTYTTGSGLAGDDVYGVYASGSTIYAATNGGLSVSRNNGTSWTNYASGLASSFVWDVYAADSTIYAATNGGLSVSRDNGATWTNYTTGNGLGSNSVRSVYATGSKIYAATGIEAATGGGVSVSTNSGANWTTYTSGSGLPGQRRARRLRGRQHDLCRALRLSRRWRPERFA